MIGRALKGASVPIPIGKHVKSNFFFLMFVRKVLTDLAFGLAFLMKIFSLAGKKEEQKGRQLIVNVTDTIPESPAN